jgi:crotonobetainyl-CoA:carnitine CoA-transferase CaiB-like acyl-CoA transferase
VGREIPPQAGNDHPTLRPMGLYPTADGHLNVAAAWGRLWIGFCSVIGRTDLPSDPRFATPTDRVVHHDELTDIICEALRHRTTAEWVDALNAVGVPAGPVNDLAQTFDDPQVVHLGVASSVRHPIAGDIEIIRNATSIEGVPDAIRRPSPLPGQHTDEILAQFGVSAERVARLVAGGVIGRRLDPEEGTPEDGGGAPPGGPRAE